jgi:hypothetical protein
MTLRAAWAKSTATDSAVLRLGALYALYFDAELAVGFDGFVGCSGVGDEHVDLGERADEGWAYFAEFAGVGRDDGFLGLL